MNYYSYSPRQNYLMHFGIKGQKWGIRRFQNPDGTLTEEGLLRYRKSIDRGYNLITKGQTREKVIARTALTQAGLTAAAVMGSASAFKYQHAINSKYYKTGANVVRLANLNYGPKISRRDALRWLFSSGKGLSKEKIKDIVEYKTLYNIGTGMKRDAIMSSITNKVVPFLSNLGYIGYGVATASNLYKGLRDYSDIRNAEIAKGLGKEKRT